MTMNLHKYISVFFILLVSFTNLNAQSFSRQRGVPFIKNFYSEDYKSHEQCFDVVQDKEGVMYFANFEAVLIFNGSEWFKIPTKSGMRVLDLDINLDGDVFVSGLYDFGFIKKDNYGRYFFNSLVDSTLKIDEIGEVFGVHCTQENVYFVSKNNLFIYKNNSVTTVKFENEAINSYNLDNDFFIFFKRDLTKEDLTENGLVKYENNKFTKIKDNSIAQIVDLVSILKINSTNEFLILTQNQGFFRLKNNEIQSIDNKLNIYFEQKSFTSAKKINDNNFVLGTSNEGIILIDNNLNVLQTIDKQSSLIDNAVNNLFLDYYNNVWVVTDNGISYIENTNSFSIISFQNLGFEGKINKIVKFENQIFLATDKGLFVFQNSEFKRVGSFDVACWDAFVYDKFILLATPEGLYYYYNNIIFETEIKDFVFCIEQSNYEKERFYIGHNSIISIIKIDNNKVVFLDKISGLNGNVIKIVSSKNENLYVEIPPGEILLVNSITKKIIKIHNSNGFISLHINKLDDEVFFSSEKGLFMQSPNSDTLIKYKIRENEHSSELWMYDFFEVKKDYFLFTDGSRKNLSKLVIDKSTFQIDKNIFFPISDFIIRCLVYDDTTFNILYGTNKGVLIQDLQQETNNKPFFPVLITKIVLLKNDSLYDITTFQNINLKSSENSVKFEFTAPYYSAFGNIKYRYFLNGFDRDTSDWISMNYKEYTNLPKGEYSFYLVAQDQFGNKIQPVILNFEVLTPIYVRWWMIIIYIVVLVALIKLFLDWQNSKATKEKEKLEEIIKERTSEIEKSKAEIEAQRDIEYRQRKEIMDSIHYAKRIQHAVLPSQEILEDIFKTNYFILFRPYEIVSGDFFWIKQMKNFIAVVAADCTGHGVPGAFMSMLGISFLNEIVTRRSLDSTGEVLDRLRVKVKTSLHQKGKQNEQKDGMDIAMYFIDLETLELQYSGAYNSLYIVRRKNLISDEIKNLDEKDKLKKYYEDESSDSEFGLIELKASRQPIGIHIREIDFVNQNMKLEKGDCIYSFSDGYQDQFGGSTGEKFNAKRFKKVLVNIQEKEMDEQKLLLEQNFIKWKGDLSQVDDVLIVGIKIDF